MSSLSTSAFQPVAANERIASLDGPQLLEITRFLAERPELPHLLRFGRPSLEQLYLRLNGGRL